MKEICICIVKETNEVHSIGIWDDEKQAYYSKEAGGWISTTKNKHIFEFEEISFIELRELVTFSLNAI